MRLSQTHAESQFINMNRTRALKLSKLRKAFQERLQLRGSFNNTLNQKTRTFFIAPKRAYCSEGNSQNRIRRQI